MPVKQPINSSFCIECKTAVRNKICGKFGFPRSIFKEQTILSGRYVPPIYLFEGEFPGDDPKALPAGLRSSGGGILNNLS